MLSIVIPCYNVSKFISEAIDSLLNQSYKINMDFEIICIDDHSSDETLSIIDNKKSSGIRIISLEKNCGVSHARNIGMQEALGNFIWFFDADDIAAPDSLQTIFNNIAAENEFDALRFPASYVAEESSSINIIKLNNELTTDNLYCFVFKRSFLIDKMLKFSEVMTYSEDVAFLCLCFINKLRIKDIYNPLYYYRQRASSLMHDRNEIKYFKSICQLPYYYNEYKMAHWKSLSVNQRHNLQELIFDAVQASLMHAVRKPTAVLKKVVKSLSTCGLYPYPIRWKLISIKHGGLTAFSKAPFLFVPSYSYLLIFNKVIGVIRNNKIYLY